MEYESTEAKKLVSLLETSESQEKAYWLSRTRRAIVIWSIVFVLLALSVTFIVLGLSERSRYIDFELHYIKYDDDEARTDIYSGMEERRATIYDTIDNIAPPDNVEGYDFTGNYYNSSNYEVVVKPESNVKESLTYENSLYMQYELGHYKLTIETGVGSTERFETPEGAVGYNKLMFITPQDLQSSSANNFVGKWLDYNDTKSVTYVGNSLLNMYSLNNAVVARDNSTASGYRVQDYDGKSNNHIYGFKTNIGGKEVQYIITEAYYVNDGEKPGDSGVTIRSTYLVEKKIGGETVLKNFANGYKPVFTKDKQGNETTVPEYEYYNGKYIYKAKMENGKPLMIDITSEKDNANAFRMPGKDTVVNVWWEADDRYVVIVDTVDEYSKNVIFGNKDNATILNNYNLSYDTVEGYITDARNNGENNDWTTLLDDYRQYDIDWSNAIVIPKDIGQNNVGTLVSSYVQDYSGKLSQKGTTGNHYYPVSKLGYNRNAWEIYSKDASGNWGWKRVEYDTNINSDINKEVCILIRPVWLVESVKYVYDVESIGDINFGSSLAKYKGYGSDKGRIYVKMFSAMGTSDENNINNNRYLVNSNANNIETAPVIARGGYSFVGWQIPSKYETSKYEMRYNNSIGVSNMGYADIVNSKGTTEYRNIIIEQPSIACQYAGVKSLEWKVVENGDWVKATSSNASNKNLYMGEATIEESGALVYYRFYYFGTYDQLTSDTQVITKIPYGYYVRTMETSSSGEAVWKKATEMRLSPVWEIIDYHITLDYNITTTNDGVDVKAQDELLLKNNNGEYVESAYGVLYGVRNYTKPTDPDDIVKEAINDINVETGFVKVYNIGNSITLPGTAQLYRRGYTLVGYDIINKVSNAKIGEIVGSSLGASNIKINGTDGVVKDLYGDIVFKAIWKQKEYTTETKTTPSKDDTTGNIALLQGTTNIAYSKNDKVINQSTYVALLNGSKFSFLDQSTRRNIQTSKNINANYSYQYHKSSEPVVYVRLNDYFSDSTFNINLQFSNIDCGLIGFDSFEGVITAQDLFNGIKVNNKAELNYTQSITKSVNGRDLVIATVNISIVKDETEGNVEEYYKIVFSNLSCSVKFDLSEINYNLVESNILLNPNYKDANSRIENIKSTNFVADNWYFLSDNTSYYIGNIVEYNRVHANKIRYVITYDKASQAYRVFDMTGITKENDVYKSIKILDISYFDNALVGGFDDKYLSSAKLQSRLADISLLDRAKLSTALLSGESKESNQYASHNDNGAIKNTKATYISLQGASYKAKVSVANDSNAYKGLFNRSEIESSYLVTNATNAKAKFTTPGPGSDEYSTKFGTYAKDGETIGFVSKIPSMYINIQLFAEKDGTTNKADDDVKYTILNENDSALIENITATVGAGTTTYGRMLKFITNSISAYDVVNGELIVNNNDITSTYIDSLDGDKVKSRVISTYIPFTSSFIFKVEFSGKYAQFNSLSDQSEKEKYLKSMFSGLDFKSKNSNAYLVTYDNNYYIVVDLRKYGRLSEENTTYIGKGNSEKNSEKNRDKGEILANRLEIYVSNPQGILNSFNLNFNNYVVGYNLDTTNPALLTTTCGWGNIETKAEGYKNNSNIFEIYGNYAQAKGLYQGKNYEYKITLSAEYINSPISITISYKVGETTYSKTISKGQEVSLNGVDDKGDVAQGLTTTVSFVRLRPDSQEYILTINNVDTTLDVSFNNIYRNIHGFSFASDIISDLFNENGAIVPTDDSDNGESTTLINIRVAGKRYITIDNTTGTYNVCDADVSDAEQNFTMITETNGKTALEILQEILLSKSKLITEDVLKKNYLIKLKYVDSAGNIQTAYFITQDTKNANNNLAIMFIRNIETVTGYEVKMKVGNGFLNKLTPQSATSPFDNYHNFKYIAEQYKLNDITDNIALEYSYSYKDNSLTINVGNGDAKTPDKPSYNSTIFAGENNSNAYIIGSDQFSLVRGDKTEEVSELDWFKTLISGKRTTSEGEVSNGLIDIRDFSYSNGSSMNILYGSYLVLALTAKTGYNKTFKLILKDTAGTTLVAITYNADPKSDENGNKTYYAIDKLDDSICSAWDSGNKIQYVAVMLKDKDAINTTVDGSFTLDIVNPINVYSFKDTTADEYINGDADNYTIKVNNTTLIRNDNKNGAVFAEHNSTNTVEFILGSGCTNSGYSIKVSCSNSGIGSLAELFIIEKPTTIPAKEVTLGDWTVTFNSTGFTATTNKITGDIEFQLTTKLTTNTYSLTLNAEATAGDALAGGIEIGKLDTTKPMIATAIAGTDESFAEDKNTYNFTHGNAITLTFRPHANYMKSGYIFTITIGSETYTIGYNDVKGYVDLSRSEIKAENDTNITLKETWPNNMVGVDEDYFIITLKIGDTKTTSDITISVGGMTEDTFTITESTGSTSHPKVVVTGATAKDGKYTLATTYTNKTIDGKNVLQAVINVKAEYELISFEITENRYGDIVNTNGETLKKTTLFKVSEHLESIRNAKGTAIKIDATIGTIDGKYYSNPYGITLSVVYIKIDGVDYYQCTFTFTKGLTFDAEFKTNIEMETYAVKFANYSGYCTDKLSDIVDIISGTLNEKDVDGSYSKRALSETELTSVVNGEISIPAGSSLRVVFKIKPKYMYLSGTNYAYANDISYLQWQEDADNNINYDRDFGGLSNGNHYYYRSMYNNAVWGSSDSNTNSNDIIIEVINVTTTTDVTTIFQEKGYAMTLSDNSPFGKLPSGLTDSWTCNKEYDDNISEYGKHTYSQIESGIIKYTATLSEAYSKADLKFNVTYTKIETGEITTKSAIVVKNNGDESGVANDTGATIVSVSINKGEVIVIRHQMAYYDITVTFDAPEINKYSITLQNIADNVDVVEYTPSTDEQGNIVHTYTLYKTDIIADSESPNFSTMGILESQGSGKYRAIIGVFTINTYGQEVYYLDGGNYKELTSDKNADLNWTNLLSYIKKSADKKLVLYYEHISANSDGETQNIKFNFSSADGMTPFGFGFKRLVDIAKTSETIETQNKDILFAINAGTDVNNEANVAVEMYDNCNIVYALTFESLVVSDYDKLSYNGNEEKGLPSKDHSSEIGGLSVYDEDENLLSVYGKDNGTYSLVSEYFKYSKVEFNLGAQYVDALTEEINGTKYLKSEFIDVNCGVLGKFRLHQDEKLHQDGKALKDANNNEYFRFIAEFSYWTGAKITINESLLTPALYNYMLDYIANENDNICDNAKYLGYNNTDINDIASEKKIVAITEVYYCTQDGSKTPKVHLATITVTITGTNITGLSSIYQLSPDGKDESITKDKFKGFGNLIRVPYGTNIEVKIEINSTTASQNMDLNFPNYSVKSGSFTTLVEDSSKLAGYWKDGDNQVKYNVFNQMGIDNSYNFVGIYSISNITKDVNTTTTKDSDTGVETKTTDREFAFNLHRNQYYLAIPKSIGIDNLETAMWEMVTCQDHNYSNYEKDDVNYDYRQYYYGDAPILQIKKNVNISNVDYNTYNDRTSYVRSGVFQLKYESSGNIKDFIDEAANPISYTYNADQNATIIDNRLPANRYALTFEAKNGYEGTRELVLTNNNGTNNVTLIFYSGTAYDSAESGSITINSGLSATINIDDIINNKDGKLYFAVTGDDVVFGSEFTKLTATIVQTFSAKYTQALGKYSVGKASNISLGEFGGKLNVSEIYDTSMTVDIQVDYVKDYYFSALGVNSYTTHIDTKNMSIVEGADADAISGYELTLEDGVSTIIKLQAGADYSRATEFVMYSANGTKYTISYDRKSNGWNFTPDNDNLQSAYYGLDVNDKMWKWYSGTQSTLINEGNYFDSDYFTIYSITMSQNSNGNNIFEMKIALNSNFNGKTINIEIEDSQINQETLQFKADNSNDKLDHVDKMFSKIELMVWNSVGLVGNTSYGDGGSSVSDFFTTSSFTLPVDATISLHLTLAKGYYNIDKLTINGIVDAIAGDYDGNFTIGSVDYSKESHTLVYTFSNIKNFTFTFSQAERDSYTFKFNWDGATYTPGGIATVCPDYDRNNARTITPSASCEEKMFYSNNGMQFSFTIDQGYILSRVNGKALNDLVNNRIGDFAFIYDRSGGSVTLSGPILQGATIKLEFEKKVTTFTLNYLDTDYNVKTTKINLTYGQKIKEAILIALRSVGESLTSLGFSETDLLPKTTGLKYVGFTFFGEDIVNGDTTYTHVVRKTDTSGNLLYPYTFETFAGYNNMYVCNGSNINFVNEQYMIIYSDKNASLPIVSPDCTIDDEGSARFKILSSNNNIGVIYAYVDQTVTLDYNKGLTDDKDKISDMTIKYSFADYSHVFFLNNNVEVKDDLYTPTVDSEYIIAHKARPYQVLDKFVDIGEKYTWKKATRPNGIITPIFQSTKTAAERKIELLKALNSIVVYDGEIPKITLYAQYVDVPIVIDFLDESKTLAIKDVVSGYTGEQTVVESDSGQKYDSVYVQSSDGSLYLYYLFNVFGSNNNRYGWLVGESSEKISDDNSLSVSTRMYLDYLPSKLRLGDTSKSKRIVDYVLCIESNGSFTDTGYRWSNYTDKTLSDMLIDYWSSLDKNTTALQSTYNLTLKVEMGNPVSVVFDVSDHVVLSNLTSANGDLKFTFYSGSQDVYDLIRKYIKNKIEYINENDLEKQQQERNKGNILAKYFMIPDANGGYINGNAGKASTISCDYAVIGTTQGSGHEYLTGDTLDIDRAVADNVDTLVLHIGNPRGGDKDNPFIIDDAYSWNKILLNNMSGGKYFIQTADLNLTELSRSQQGVEFNGYYEGAEITLEDGTKRYVTLDRTKTGDATENDPYPIFGGASAFNGYIKNLNIIGSVENPKFNYSENDCPSWGNLVGTIGDYHGTIKDIILGNTSVTETINTQYSIRITEENTAFTDIGSLIGTVGLMYSDGKIANCNNYYDFGITEANRISALGGLIGTICAEETVDTSNTKVVSLTDLYNYGNISMTSTATGITVNVAGIANVSVAKDTTSSLQLYNLETKTHKDTAGNTVEGTIRVRLSGNNARISGVINFDLPTDSVTRNITADYLYNTSTIYNTLGGSNIDSSVAGMMTITGGNTSTTLSSVGTKMGNEGYINVLDAGFTNISSAATGGILLKGATLNTIDIKSRIINTATIEGSQCSSGAMLLRTGSNVTNALNLQFENSGQVTGNKLASGGLLITENNSKSITGTINISNSTNSGNITATMLAGGIMASYYDQKSVMIGIGPTSNTTKGVVNSGAISAGSGYGAGIYSVYAAQKDSSNAEVSCTAEIINVENLGFITGKYVAGIVQGVYQANTKWCINGDGTTVTLEDGTTAIKASVTSTDGVASGIAVVRRGITDLGSANNASITASITETTTAEKTKTIATGIVAVCAWGNGVISLNSSSNSKPSTANSIIKSSGYASGVAYINGVTNADYTAYISACANSQVISGKIASGILVVDSDTLGDRVFDIGENGNTTNSGAITGTLLASGISGYIQGDGLTNLITFNLKQAVTTELGLKFIQVQTAYSNAYAAGIAVAIGGFVNQINGKIVNVKQVYVDSPSGGDCIAMVAGLVVAKYANIISGYNGINDSPTAKVFALVPVIYGDEDADGNQTIKQGAILTGGIISYGVDDGNTYNIKGIENNALVGSNWNGEIIKTGIYIVGGSNYTISGNKYTRSDLTGVRQSQTGVDLSNLPEDWYLSIRF